MLCLVGEEMGAIVNEKHPGNWHLTTGVLGCHPPGSGRTGPVDGPCN